MVQRMRENNPVFARLIDEERPPSLLLVVIGGLTLALLGLVYLAAVGLVFSNADITQGLFFPLQALTGVLRLVTVIVPLSIAGMAATIAARDSSDGSFQMMQVTSLIPQRIVGGYAGAALYRSRVGIALMLALIPFFFAPLVSQFASFPAAVGPAPWAAVIVQVAVAPLRAIGAILMAVFLGVMFGTLTNTEQGALFGALGSYFVLAVIAAVTFFAVNLAVFLGTSITVVGVVSSLSTIASFAFIVLSYVLALVFRTVAVRRLQQAK